MSLNIKIGPSETDESSDEDLSNTVASCSHHLKTTETRCPICLEEFRDACYTNTCNHMFCFDCLKQWSAIKSTCPLCIRSFEKIHHSLSECSPKTFEVPIQPSRSLRDRILQDRVMRNSFFFDTLRRPIPRSTLNHEEVPEEEIVAVNLTANGRLEVDDSPYIELIIFEMRRRVYRENMWAEPLPDLSGQFRDCSPTFFSENPAQVNRIQHFISRDVHAIFTIERLRININITETYVTDLIMQSILSHEIEDEHTINILLPYFGPLAAHVCHELYNFASSPLDRLDYDVNVHYSIRLSNESYQNAPREISVPSPTVAETITPMENNNSYGMIPEVRSRSHPNDIAIQSSSDIRNLLLHPFDVNNILDQPSTSTGIQNSVDQPNNRSSTNQQSETILLGSDNSTIGVESGQYPNDVTIQSSSDNSGVENLRPSLHPSEELGSRNRPSP